MSRLVVTALLAMGLAGPAAGHGGGAGAVAWNWDPVVAIGLGLAVVAYLLGAARMQPEQRRRLLGGPRCAAFAAGVVVLVVALLSPLDALADRLFSAHMVQHLLLLLIAPPLLVIGRPAIAWLWAFDLRGRRALGRTWAETRLPRLLGLLMRPLPVWLALSFVLWFWHLPTAYAWALDNEAIHILEHLSFLFAAAAFWNIVIQPYGRRVLDYGATIVYVASIGFQNGLIGALLAFAAQPFYPIHAMVTAPYGLTPLEDQQLAGMIMWVPASAIFVAAMCALFVAWLREAERRAPAVNPFLPPSAMRCAPLAPLLLIVLVGCADDEANLPRWQVPGGEPRRGVALIEDYGCGACHTIPGVDGADANVGPPLTRIGERSYVAGVLRNTPDNLARWIRFPQRVVPGNAMPNLGVSERDANDIAAYLYTLR